MANPAMDDNMQAALEEDVGQAQLEEARKMREDRLQMLGATIAKYRDLAVSARRNSGIEKQWSDDQDHYNGIDPTIKASMNLVDVAVQNSLGGVRKSKHVQHRSRVFANLTRPRTNTAEARIADMLLPSDDRNWGITPVARSEVKDQLADKTPLIAHDGAQVVTQDEGQQRQATVSDLTHLQLEQERKACEGMQGEIDRQLTESDYNGEVRKVLHDASVLGTGVLKGPVVVSRTKKKYTPIQAGSGELVHVLQIVEDLEPASNRVNPWDFFPDPFCGENIHNGSFVLERSYKTPRQLRQLAKCKGYMPDQIRKVLSEKPMRSSVYDAHDVRNRDQAGFSSLDDSRYEVWEFRGEVEREDLEAMDVEVPDDELQAFDACVIVVNNTVIKGAPEPIEDGGFCYDVLVWEKCEGHWTGYGVPYLMRTAQRILNAGWRQIMDNAGLSVGPQIVMKRNMIEPADQNWELTGRKLWYAADETEDVRQAFAMFEISSHLEELIKIIELAMKFVDDESMVPQIAQGEHEETPDTLGGMTILMNSANIVLKRIVKQFDDMITRPHIQRYYDYNMQYNPRPEIKGDFSVEARGSSALVVRDTQNTAFVQSLVLGQSPVYGHMIKKAELLRKALSARSIDPDDVVEDDQTIAKIEAKLAQQQGQQSASPDAQARAQASVQVAQIRAQGEMAKVHAQTQADQSEAEFREKQHAADQSARVQELMLQRDIEMMKLSAMGQMSLDEIKARLADTAIKERTKRDLAAAGRVHDHMLRNEDRIHEAQQPAQAAPQ